MLRRLPAALALLGLAAAASSAPAQEPRLARIAYAANGNVYTVAADGSDRHLVTEDAAEPAWSPDGRMVAWTRFRDDQFVEAGRAWVSAPDGADARPLTDPSHGRYDSSPTWSPDGQRVAFVRANYGQERTVTTLMSAAAAGGDERRIAQIASSRYVGLLGADWSPDGAKILVTVGDLTGESSDPPELHVVDAARGTRTRLLRKAGYGRWSPAGDRIAYVGERAGCEDDACGELYVANADGGGRRRLTTNDTRELTPTWAPGADRVVFGSYRNYPVGGSVELYSVGVDGSCLTWLTNGTAYPFGPDFEPGAGLSSDPGACGATPREPLIETDTSELARYDDVPIWWLGPRFGDLLLSYAEEESGNADFDYEDCARYEPSDCPPPVTMTQLPACSASLGFGNGTGLSRRQGALLYTPPDRDDEEHESVTLVAGPTTVFLDVRDAALRGVLDALRPFGQDAPPAGGLPRAQLPARYLRMLERATAAVRKYGSRDAARRLGISRARVRERVAVHRRLRELGPFGRLACGR